MYIRKVFFESGGTVICPNGMSKTCEFSFDLRIAQLQDVHIEYTQVQAAETPQCDKASGQSHGTRLLMPSSESYVACKIGMEALSLEDRARLRALAVAGT